MSARARAQTYASLSPAAQLVAQAFGCVYPNDPARARVVRWLAQADLLASGERITQANIKDAMGELIAARILELGKKGTGTRINGDWASCERTRRIGSTPLCWLMTTVKRKTPGGMAGSTDAPCYCVIW